MKGIQDLAKEVRTGLENLDFINKLKVEAPSVTRERVSILFRPANLGRCRVFQESILEKKFSDSTTIEIDSLKERAKRYKTTDPNIPEKIPIIEFEEHWVLEVYCENGTHKQKETELCRTLNSLSKYINKY